MALAATNDVGARAGATPGAAARQHGDVFTGDEAAAYLHLDSAATLDWLSEKGFLSRHKIGKAWMYHRDDLDRCALLMFGKDPSVAGPALRLAGGRR